jgi:hypothetical protein
MKKSELNQLIKEELQKVLSENNPNVTFYSFLEGLHDRSTPDPNSPGRSSLFISQKQWDMLKWLYVRDISKPRKDWDRNNNRWVTPPDDKVNSWAIKNDTFFAEVLPPSRGTGRLFIFIPMR